MSLRLAFAGTPEFAKVILAELLKTENQMLAVFTQADKPKGRGQELAFSPVKILALEHNIPIFQPLRLKDPEIEDVIKKLNLDFLIVAAYGMIIPKSILNLPKFGCINVHASLLPKYRGAAPIQHAILAGDAETGITIMQMDIGLDTGDIWSLYPCKIEDTDTSETLHTKLMHLGAKALVETLDKIAHAQLQRVTQNQQQSSYAAKIHKEDGRMQWSYPAIQLERCIRAFNPWPIAFSQIANQTVRIWKSQVVAQTNESLIPHKPGTIIASDKEAIDVMTGQGILRLLELQLPGGKRLPVSQILLSKSNLFAVGCHFE